MIVKILFGAAALALAIGIVLSLAVRLAPLDPEAWALDPLSAPRGLTNAALVAPTEALQPGAGPADFESPVYAAPPTELSLALDAMVLAQPRTSRVLGAPGDGPVTYVQRSSVFGFPDYVTVLTLPAPEGATLAAISRSRFGSSDFGVNKARLSAWLKALEPLEQ